MSLAGVEFHLPVIGQPVGKACAVAAAAGKEAAGHGSAISRLRLLHVPRDCLDM
jgi:hypothetical protein